MIVFGDSHSILDGLDKGCRLGLGKKHSRQRVEIRHSSCLPLRAPADWPVRTVQCGKALVTFKVRDGCELSVCDVFEFNCSHSEFSPHFSAHLLSFSPLILLLSIYLVICCLLYLEHDLVNY